MDSQSLKRIVVFGMAFVMVWGSVVPVYALRPKAVSQKPELVDQIRKKITGETDPILLLTGSREISGFIICDGDIVRTGHVDSRIRIIHDGIQRYD